MINQVTLVGAISSQFTYDHSIYGEKYYRVTVTVTRDSGVNDNIPVIVSDRLINVRENYLYNYVAIKGQFRSYNLHEPDKNKLLLFVFACEIELLNQPSNYNDIYLEGCITKPAVYRWTPLGREIADILLAVRRDYGKCDYIPCVCWGRTAKYVNGLQVGTTVKVAGRVQSRDYVKDGQTKTAYEVSVNLAEEC